MKNEHFGAIDGLRTIACIGIVLMHVAANNAYSISGFIYESMIPSFTNFVFLFMRYPLLESETYIFKLGHYLKSQGHEVRYFGMEHKGRCVGNAVNAYTTDMFFHGGSKLVKLTYPLKTIYSSEARKKLRLVLDDFKTHILHINNARYQGLSEA